MTEFMYQLLFAASIEMLLATAFVGAIAFKHRMTVGIPERREKGTARLLLVFVPIAVALALAIQLKSEFELVPFLPGLAGVVVCLLFLPRTGSSVLGAKGVRVGWFSRTFEQLEEWRLTGDHLRVRIAGEWRALLVPVEEHPPLRERLEAICPDRESRFKV
jgi:hypothetical protein